MQKRIIYFSVFFILFIFKYSFVYANFNDITEESAIVLDSDGSSILYKKNIDKKIYPASTTKILTAILALENLNLNTNVTVSNTAIENVPVGSSSMYLKIGETLTVNDLLYGLLLSSGNDAAIVLAEQISGSIQNFSILMNNKLEELGCINSHFTNPHGFHDNNHYSTAYDMAIIMKYASQNETFRKICETKEYTIKETNKTLTSRTLKNTNLLLSKDLNYTLGGKTGYTDEAGNVFICYSKLNNDNVICCVYDGLKNINQKETRFIDVKMLLDNVYQNFNKTKILSDDTFKISYVNNQINKNFIFGIDKNIYCLTNNKPYIIDYTLTDLLIDNNSITGKILINAKNSDWEFKNTYDLKLLKVSYYFDNTNSSFIDKNLCLLLGVIINLIIIIILLIIIKKNKSND